MVVMDAGIPAVLGAGVGTIGMIVTGWTARSATKMQMRNESLRERREPRRASYEAFSSAVATFHDHLQPWVHFGRLLDSSKTFGDEDTNPNSYLKHSKLRMVTWSTPLRLLTKSAASVGMSSWTDRLNSNRL